MKKHTKRCVILFVTLNLFFLSQTPAAQGYNLSLPIHAKIQEQSNWCWDASVQSILDWYLKYPRQCDIANYAWGRSDCCVNPSSSSCNRPNLEYATPSGGGNSTTAVLANWGVYGSGFHNYKLSQATAVDEINAGRPFIIGIVYSLGGGHDVVGYGYDLDGKYIWLMDPDAGDLERDAYSELLTAYDGSVGDKWVDSIKITSNPRPGCQNWMASDISYTGATLKGSVIATGPNPTVTIEYGTTNSYGSTVTADISSVTGSIVITASKAISGLAPNTTYHFRAKAVSGTITYNDTDQTFTTAPLTMTVNKLGTGTGTVNTYSLLISGGAYEFTASPDPGSVFTGWSGDCSGNGDCYIYFMFINHDLTINATFDLVYKTLTAYNLGAGKGTISSTFPPSPVVNCNSACSYSFPYNTPVILTAKPNPGNIFTG